MFWSKTEEMCLENPVTGAQCARRVPLWAPLDGQKYFLRPNVNSDCGNELFMSF